MTLLNATTLAQRMLTAEADLDQLGWNLPDYLFALRGSLDDLQLELWMEMAGGALPFLTALADLKLTASDDIHGLVVVLSGTPSHLRSRLGLPPMGSLRALCDRHGVSPDKLLASLPVTPRRIRPQRRRVRALLGVLRSGEATVITREIGSAPGTAAQLPRGLGDQGALVATALKVLS